MNQYSNRKYKIMKKYNLFISLIITTIAIKILAWKALFYGFIENLPKNEDYNIILSTRLHLVSSKYLLLSIDFSIFIVLFIMLVFIKKDNSFLNKNLKLSIGYMIFSIIVVEYLFGFRFL